MIKSDIEYIEKTLFNTEFNDLNNYYNCLNEEQVIEIIKNIFLILKKEDNFSIRNLINTINNLLIKNIHINMCFNDCSFIKNYNDLLYMYISIFVIKSFQSYNTQINDIDFHNLNINNNFTNFYNSDSLINWTSNEFFNLCLAFNLKLNLDIDINHFTIRELFIKIFFICTKHDLIKVQLIKPSFLKKTYKYFYIGVNFNLNNINIKIYNSKFILYSYKKDTFLYCNHYSSIIEINRKNILSNFKFKQNINFSISLTQSYFYIDKERLLDIIDDLLLFHNIGKLSLQKDFIQLQDMLKKGIFEKNIYLISQVSKKISIYLNLIKLINISLLDLNNIRIYTPHIICFRGRFSSLSDTSYTFNKEFRYCIYLGFYEKDEDMEKSDVFTNKINEIIINYKYLLKDCNLIKSLDNFNDLEIKSLLFSTINIAELYKTELGKEVTLEKFIKKGIFIINNFKILTFKDIYDKIKIKYYIFIFNEILEKSKKKWLISKDATASCFQHLIKILGYKDKNSIKICNLNSNDTWYDTYQCNIDFFIENKIFLYLTKDDIKKYFNRKLLKPTQMKESYGMGLQNSIIEYKKNIQKNDLDNDKIKELLKLFCDFYYFLKKNPLLFNNQPTDIIYKIFDEFGGEVFFKNGEEMNLKYFKTKNIQKSYNIGNIRYTKNHQVLISELDKRKMTISARANYVQGIESAVARETWLETRCPIIHDCFMIDMYNQSYLISIVNKNMNTVYHDLGISKWDFPIFSIFIIL